MPAVGRLWPSGIDDNDGIDDKDDNYERLCDEVGDDVVDNVVDGNDK